MSCQLSALCTGTPVSRSHSTVVSRWLVMPSATMSETVSCTLASASEITNWTLRQICSASCSTCPGRGKMCSCSIWLTETMRAPRSKTMHRDDAVPWSTDATKRSFTLALLPGCLPSPRDRPEVAGDRARSLAHERHEVHAWRAVLRQPLDRAGDADRA